MSSRSRRRPGHAILGPDWARLANRSVAAATAAGVEAYDRQRHLPRLIAADPDWLSRSGRAAQDRIVSRLASALRAERTRGRAGHWTYDLNRHIALKQAYAAERKVLQRLKDGTGIKNPPPGPATGF